MPSRSRKRPLGTGALVLGLLFVGCDDNEGGDDEGGQATTTSTLAGADPTTFLGTVVEPEAPDQAAIDDYCADIDAYVAAVDAGTDTPEALHDLGVRSLELERAVAGAPDADAERERIRECAGRLPDLGVAP